ncbi:MAG: DedA family protein [Campylobacterales bacterium]|nr:DedA family protein [Campylobacterales bacterium]
MIKELSQELVDLIFDWGYWGIFILMSIESSFLPLPSEIVLIPAGYLASQGQMNISLIVITASAGSLAGAFVNYFLALSLGRKILKRYGKYFFVNEDALTKMDDFFKKHGHISTFIGRLLPVIRHLISIPAGLARMNLVVFSIYTTLGSAIWAFILVMLGYFIGENQELINEYLHQIIIILVIAIVILGSIYAYYQKRKRSRI